MINKNTIISKIEERQEILEYTNCHSMVDEYDDLIYFIHSIDKELSEIIPTIYVVTRCEEHSDYVEKVFIDEDKANEYCNQFKDDENEYARDITPMKITV